MTKLHLILSSDFEIMNTLIISKWFNGLVISRTINESVIFFFELDFSQLAKLFNHKVLCHVLLARKPKAIYGIVVGIFFFFWFRPFFNLVELPVIWVCTLPFDSIVPLSSGRFLSQCIEIFEKKKSTLMFVKKEEEEDRSFRALFFSTFFLVT